MESGPVVKTISLLETMAGGKAPRALADLAASSGIARSTVHRLLQLLIRLGYAETSGGGAYRLTSKLRQLVAGQDDQALSAVAMPMLRSLHEQTQETVNLGVLTGDCVSYVLVLDSIHPLRRIVRVGEKDPFHSTALGQAIVAYLPSARRSQLAAAARTARRGGSVGLDEALAQVRRQGYAVEQDQNDVGVTCVGAPVFQDASVVAAISLSAASARVTSSKLRRWSRLVRDAAHRITASLGSAEG